MQERLWFDCYYSCYQQHSSDWYNWGRGREEKCPLSEVQNAGGNDLQVDGTASARISLQEPGGSEDTGRMLGWGVHRKWGRFTGH